MLVSIIIPVYNVEQYIIRCVESVLNQTYRQLEIIFVDDCTPDYSMEVIRRFITETPKSQNIKFKYLQHDINRGLSAARNTGIDVAEGEYLFFLDSDDEITPDCIETLVKASENGTIDVVCGALELCGSVEMFTFSLMFYDVYYQSKNDVLKAFASDKIPIAAWNKLLRRKVIVDEKLFFKEGLIYEDNLWTFELVHCVRSLKTLTSQTYHYWIHKSSIMTSTRCIQKYDYLLSVFAEREKFLRDRKLNNPITQNYLIKNKAAWIQCRIVDSHISYQEKWRLVSSVLALEDKYTVVLYGVLYHIRWVLHQIKCIVCH